MTWISNNILEIKRSFVKRQCQFNSSIKLFYS